jgi:hypothetical protein
VANDKGDKLVQQPCKHFERTGSCRFGSGCFYAHNPHTGVKPTFEAQDQLEKPTRLQKTRNNGRATAFRKFLLDNFGREMLNQVWLAKKDLLFE